MCDVMLPVLLLVTWCGAGAAGASGHSLQHLLRHPHYSQGHRHAVPTTQHSSLELKARWPEPSPKGPWVKEENNSRMQMQTTSKDFYKHQKTSAMKTQKIDPSITKELWEVREANEHFVRMRQETLCEAPRPRVVRAREFYPNKDILPRCTVLHRCTEDSGCCEDAELTCTPKTVQQVSLYFYVIDESSTSSVERLLFPNHTECECRPRAQADHAISTRCDICPTPFVRRELEDGRCSCDCFDKHKACIRIKRGREPLEDTERRCVESRRCHVPECEYGPFDPERGRCPRRPEHEGPKTKNGNQRNPNHRWTYFERD